MCVAAGLLNLVVIFMDGIKHADDCFPGNRTTEIISPVVGFRCRQCGAETDRYKDMIKLLRLVKMFIVENKGYCESRNEEIAIIKEGMDELKI